VTSDLGASRPLALAVIGVSTGATCGVRDHATLLARELAHESVSCELHWLTRTEASLRGSRSQMRGWSRRLAGELLQRPPDAVLLHYSVFSYSYKGVPLFVRPTLAALAAPGLPILSFMHEFAYPWRVGGWRGNVWALTQRAILRELLGRSAAVIVTADYRASWIASRRWLPTRPMCVAPVFSTLPAPSTRPAGARGHALIGLFGYAYDGAAVAPVLDAVRELRARGRNVRLSMLGAPGRASAAGEEWSQAASARDLGDALSFSGRLPAQQLSDALAGCDVLLFPDASGPASRKTTLAASLASGVPVVAIDGPHTWGELVRGHAARVVPPGAAALADAISGLLADAQARRTLGARGRAFAEREMAVARSANAVRTLLEDVLERGSR